MIRFVVALAAEARPLLERYRMQRVEAPFPLYEGEDAGSRSCLIVSGAGGSAAAAAVGFLGGRYSETPGGAGAWLNVGVAGHRSLEPGTTRLAHTVRDDATGRVWYPPRIGSRSTEPSPLPAGSALRTVAAPESRFDTDDLYDMEAAGFYPAALRFATAELVQCFKIVSDNRRTQARELTQSRLGELVDSALGEIGAFAEHLRKLSLELPVAADPALLRLERFRFTTSQKRKLRRLVTRLAALGGLEEVEASARELASPTSPSEALDRLEKRVEAIART